MKKILLSLFMLMGTMCSASAVTTTIWEGSEVAAWENRIDINKNWADLNEGDVLTFTAETSTGAVFHLLDVCWEKKVENIYFSEGVATVTITSAIIEKAVLAYGSIGVQGDSFTLKKVELITADEPEPLPSVSLNSKGLATFSVVHNLSIKTEGVKAYKAAVNGVTITLTELDGYIPAGTGVILRGEAGATVGFEAPASGVTDADVTGNVLKATTKADGTLETKPSSGNVYALNGDKFLEYTPDTFVANKAYIAVEGPAANELHIVFADAEQGNTTGIESIEAAAQTLTFDLNGRMATVRGLQIKNGKAVFVK